MKSFFQIILLILCVGIFPKKINAQTKAQKINQLISGYAFRKQFNGVVLVAENDKMILSKGYGYANFQSKFLNTPNTKFRIGSITKTFTDVLVLQQIEKNKLALNGIISDYLLNYPKLQGEQVTIYNLMTHTSGIPDYDEMDINYSAFYPHEKIMSMFDSLPLDFKPGTKFKYSNSDAYILGVILEKVTGKTFAQLLNENIVQPLRLKNTEYNVAADFTGFANSYRIKNSQILEDTAMDLSVAFSAYGMYSTAEDLYKWSEALYNNTLLSDSSLQLYFKPYLNNWACDWLILKNPYNETSDSTIMTLRGGSLSRFICFIARITNNKDCIILLDNTGSEKSEEMIKKITGILYDKNYK